MKLINKLNRFLEEKKYEIIISENQVNIVNFEEIIDFTFEKIILKCNAVKITIEGKKLIISKMSEQEMLITGSVTNISII